MEICCCYHVLSLYIARKEVIIYLESDFCEEENTTKFEKPKSVLCLNFCQAMFGLFSRKADDGLNVVVFLGFGCLGYFLSSLFKLILKGMLVWIGLYMFGGLSFGYHI